MCGAGLEQYYLDILEQEKQDNDIQDVLFSNFFIQESCNDKDIL